MQYRWTIIYRQHPTNILARAQNEIREKQQGILKTLWPIHKVSEFRVRSSLSEIVIQHYYQKNMDSIHNNDSIFRKFLDWKTKGGNRIINCCSKCKWYRLKNLFSAGKITQLSDYKHCVKNVRTEYRKIRTRNNSVFGDFSCSESWKNFDFTELMLLKFLVESWRGHITNSK